MTGLPLTSAVCFAMFVLAAITVTGSDAPEGSSESGSAEPGKQVARETTVMTEKGEVTVRYWLYMPKETKSDVAQPLVLFLHGAGERGTDMELVKKWGPPLQAEEGKELPFVVISPQCPEGENWNIEAMGKLVDHVATELPINKQRIYATGLSMGGYGTWMLLAARPELFAAGVPICGGGDPKSADTLARIPIWAFHGDQDTAVPLIRSQEMVDAIEKAGGTRVKLTIYPGVGHNSWSPTYDNPEVYQWLLSQQRSEHDRGDN
jgi:predicted peptidase